MLLPTPVGAATPITYYVGSTGDSTTAVTAATCESSSNATCTLRDAIDDANTDGSGSVDTISFASLPSPSTILLDPTNGPLDIADAGTLTISGQGITATIIDGAGGTEVFSTSGSSVTLSNLTIQHGSSSDVGGGLANDGVLTLSSVSVQDNTASSDGGGIYNDGQLTTTDVSIDNNTADDGGGGIYSEGPLNMTGGSISSNSSGGAGCCDEDGGGLYNDDAATLNQVAIADNSGEYGGGVYNDDDGTLTLTQSTVNGNIARDYEDGGGIANQGTLTATNDTIADNTSLEYGGGVANDRSGAKATLVNDTISGNNALEAAGGIYNDSDSGGAFLDVEGSVIDGNVIYNNTPSQCFGYGSITSMGYNVVGPENDSTCAFTATGDQTDTSALLGTLGNNGGPTQTIPLYPSSPALHVEPMADCPATDQRGIARPQPSTSATCDAGAFELVPPLLGPSGNGHAYWLVGSDGGVFSFGNAQFYGSMGGKQLNKPVVGVVATGDRSGYWLDAADGGVFAFGDAGFFGSVPGALKPGQKLNAPIVGMVSSADGGGYFMVGADGGVFAFGDATFEGSCYNIGGCSGAAVAVVPDASGKGYWLITQTGNVYSFGDATYEGGPGNNGSPVTSAVRTADGGGYWILTANGAVYPYGDARSFGSAAGQFGNSDPANAIFADDDGGGYWIASANGTVQAFGDAPNDGGMNGTHLNGVIIAASGS